MTLSGPSGELAAALASAQGELEDATKSSVNPAFHSKYADLAEVLQTLRPVLSKHGLALVQCVGHYDAVGKTIQVTTALLHKSGAVLSDTVSMPVTKADAQGVGSAVTYARRYGAAAICGIAQDDDDGNAAAGRTGGGDPGPGRKGKRQVETDPAVVEDLVRRLGAATTAVELQALAPEYAKLDPAAQAKVLPVVQAARTRIG